MYVCWALSPKQTQNIILSMYISLNYHQNKHKTQPCTLLYVCLFGLSSKQTQNIILSMYISLNYHQNKNKTQPYHMCLFGLSPKQTQNTALPYVCLFGLSPKQTQNLALPYVCLLGLPSRLAPWLRGIPDFRLPLGVMGSRPVADGVWVR